MDEHEGSVTEQFEQVQVKLKAHDMKTEQVKTQLTAKNEEIEQMLNRHTVAQA